METRKITCKCNEITSNDITLNLNKVKELIDLVNELLVHK